MTGSTRASQHRSRRLGLVAFGIILLVATLGLPLLGTAMTVRGDDNVTIAAGETIDDDLIVATNRFVLDGDAALDVIVFARDVDLNGSVGGSVNAAAGTVTIRGDVDGSARVVEAACPFPAPWAAISS